VIKTIFIAYLIYLIPMSQLNLLTPIEESKPTISDHSLNNKKLFSEEQLCFSRIVGQLTAISLLKGAIVTNRIAPAYLFTGLDGIGKTLTANTFISQAFRIYLGHPDFLWVEPSYTHQGEQIKESELSESGLKRKSPPQIRIEQAREIISFFACSPIIASQKIVVIQNVDRITQSAANALLKVLEEPTKGTIILLSSQPQKLLHTITSRCQIIPFNRLSNSNLAVVLEKLGRQDIIQNSNILNLANGSPGRAIALFEQLQTIPQSLLNALVIPPNDALSALQIAKEIDITLEYHQQLWLLDYLQHQWWEHLKDIEWMQRLAKAANALNKMVSSRLVWEVLLLPT
jgi:DNA polymerase III subunit delta'